MAKGAVLIGCGFMPGQADVQLAVTQGHIKNADAVTAYCGPGDASQEDVVIRYVIAQREKGWEVPLGGVTAERLTLAGGRVMWAAYPAGVDKASGSPQAVSAQRPKPTPQPAPSSTPTSRKWWQFWKKDNAEPSSAGDAKKEGSRKAVRRDKCGFCGTNIVPHRSGASVGVDPYERMKHTGHYCAKCNVVTCCPCSRKAATKLGVSHFVCPTCGGNVHNTMV